MTKQEREDIKARALLRLHESKHEVSAHRKKLSEMAGQLKTAGSMLGHLDNLKIVNVDNRNLISNESYEAIYPSAQELVTAFREYRDAVQRRDYAQRECNDLGIVGFYPEGKP